MNGLLPLALLLKLAVFALFTQAACSSGSKSPQSLPASPTLTAQATPEVSIVILPLEEPAVTDAWKLTILDFTSRDEDGDQRAPEGSRWLLFDVEIDVFALEPVQFDFALVDVLDSPFERTDAPAGAHELLDPVPAGYSGRHVVAFVVPTDVHPSTLLYGDGDVTWALQLGMPRPEELTPTAP